MVTMKLFFKLVLNYENCQVTLPKFTVIYWVNIFCSWWNVKGLYDILNNLAPWSYISWGFPGGSVVKNLPAKAGNTDSLGWEDPMEKKMLTHSSNLAWRIPWTDVLHGLESMGSQRVGHDWSILVLVVVVRKNKIFIFTNLQG